MKVQFSAEQVAFLAPSYRTRCSQGQVIKYALVSCYCGDLSGAKFYLHLCLAKIQSPGQEEKGSFCRSECAVMEENCPVNISEPDISVFLFTLTFN